MRTIAKHIYNVTIYNDKTRMPVGGSGMVIRFLSNSKEGNDGIVTVRDLDGQDHEVGTWVRERGENSRTWCYQVTMFDSNPKYFKSNKTKWHYLSGAGKNVGFRFIMSHYGGAYLYKDKDGAVKGKSAQEIGNGIGKPTDNVNIKD